MDSISVRQQRGYRTHPKHYGQDLLFKSKHRHLVYLIHPAHPFFVREYLSFASSTFLSRHTNSGATNQSSFMALFQVVAPKCAHFHAAIGHLESARLHLQRIKATQHLGVSVDGAFDHAVHRKLVTNTPPRAIALLTLDEVFSFKSSSLDSGLDVHVLCPALTRHFLLTLAPTQSIDL